MTLIRSESDPIRTQRVPQTIETPVSFVSAPGAYIRFAYSRSSDSMASQIEGQDYLCFQHDDSRLVFVVADGVGSSFCGNLASRILGDNLLDWLWSLDIGHLGSAAALNEAATGYLNRLQKQAQHEVDEYEIPGQMSALVRQALEAQRAYGSEAIFAACRIDHPGLIIPDGLISLFWMGDTQIHVLDEDGQPIDVGGRWENANRWSTSKGVKGTMSAWMAPLGGVGRVAAFTDGLLAHADTLLNYPDARLDREIHLGARLPTSDDVALVDVVLRTPRYEGYPNPGQPDPNLERPHLEQVWNPTGEPTYELRWSWPGGGGKPSFMIQEATNPALSDSRVIEVPHGETTWRPTSPQPPGHYYYRVRAVKRFGGVTPWSELRLTKVAYPPPPAPTLNPPDPARPLELTWEGEGEALEYQLERCETPDFAAPEVVYEGRSTSWTVPTSRPGAFHYRVRAISDGGPGPFSAACEVEVKLPPPPRPHLATPGYGYEHGAFSLRWQEVPGATRYELEEMRHGEDEAPRTITLDDTVYEAAEQPVGDYTYRVRACNDFGCSEWSNEQVVLIAPQPPARAPELALEGPDERGAVHLSWNAVPSAQEYHVEASNSPDFASARVYSTTDLEVEMVRREAGALYVRVCAANRGGEGPWSEVQQSVTEPDPPAWIEAAIAADTRRINLAWGASGGHVEYCVEMSSGGEDDYAEVYRGEETQAALDAPAGAGLLRFRVRAEAPGAPSAWTESEALQASPPLPAPVLEQPDIADMGEIRVRWSAVDNAGHYRVEFSTSEDFASPRSVDTTTTRVNIRPPSAGQYWVRVRACHSGDESSQRCGNPSNVVTINVRRPAAPSLHPHDPVRALVPFDVTWTGVPGCAYYELQESPDEQFPADSTRKSRHLHPAQKASIPTRPRGRIYFRVKAVTEQGESSAWSNMLAVDVV